MKNVDGALHLFTKGFGINLEDSISRRSVGRINREGGVAAGIQVGYEFNKANVCTLSNDGTTNKHINYKLWHIMMNIPTYAPGSNPDTPLSHEVPPVQQFLGICSAVNHTSETQLQGWKDTIDSYFSMYNASPFGDEDPLNVRDFARTTTGMSTNHAEDQKKQFRLFEEWKSLCEREKHGEEALCSASLDNDVYAILWEGIERNIMEAGGIWARSGGILESVRGQEKIDAMTPEQRQYIKLFLWSGCCMHKEMNSTKGGSARATVFWKEHGLVGPIKLLNKDNRAAAASGDGVTKSRVTEAAQGGAIKLCSLARAVFAHKDKKKGQQDVLQIYMEAVIGYMICFPDTSNTHYQAFCAAVAELIIRLDFYRQFLEFIRMLKEKRMFTNMEQNVYNALSNIPTLTELCVLILYSQAISHPYMREVQGVAFVNLLNLGAKHKEVIDFLDLLLCNRQLLLSPSASYETGSLDGKPWECPEAIYAVQHLTPKLPHLEEGGKIATTSTSKKHRTFMKPTNDANEGALGAYRIDVRNKPRLSVEQHSACKMYQRNDTSSFMKMCFTPAHHKLIMRQARDQEAAHLPAQSHEKQVAAWECVEEQKYAGDAKQKQCAENKAAKEGPMVRVIDLPGLLVKPPIVSILMGHLNWYQVQGDTSIPKNVRLNRKGLVLDALVAAVERYNALEFKAASTEVAEGAQIEVEANAIQGIEDDFSESEAGDY
ncbi:hypothetical protein BOTBODRAFT_175645 [Botryobasidium botryosum FD-172 SS1]|uniref:Uncharacterized protein n=1 Tax=Botryobasidium botryosum (strain FD-172 SS1) TaxID=930990 RepID=A0A067MNB5_BOTB1|nr:hypothetical protein BOTBODRAFT_175645 [Botryobasidium botryosum FD-172 SS1]